MRQGAAWPDGATEQLPGAAVGASRAGRWPHRRAVLGCRASQAPSTRTPPRRPAGGRSGGGQGVRMPAMPSSPCPRPRPASTHPVSNVRRGRPVSTRAMSTRPVSSSRPGVRCPVSGVRCPGSVRSASAVFEPGEFAERGAAAGRHTADGRSRRGRPAVSTTGSSSPPGRTLAGSWRRLRWASAGIGLHLVVVGGLGQRPGATAWPTKDPRLSARIARKAAGVRG